VLDELYFWVCFPGERAEGPSARVVEPDLLRVYSGKEVNEASKSGLECACVRWRVAEVADLSREDYGGEGTDSGGRRSKSHVKI
jgi:hypothetical protein